MSERRRALIVANSDYEDPVLRPLLSPLEDAKELARVLGDPAIGGFEIVEPILLNAKAEAVREAIEDFFDPDKSRPDDLLLLYFSGHGLTDEYGKFHFATIDTRFNGQKLRRNSAVGASFVNEEMLNSRSRRQILLLDCCHSGAFAEGMRIKGGVLPRPETHFNGKGLVVLTASTGTQFSLEGPSGPRPQPSVYTRILVKALETGEADRDGDGWVSLDELHDYLSDKVRAEAPQQTPTKSGYLEGQMYIARSPVVRDAELPLDLQKALAATDVHTRLGAILDLIQLHQGDNPGLARAVLNALNACRSHDDSNKVRSAAARYLDSLGRDPQPKTPPSIGEIRIEADARHISGNLQDGPRKPDHPTIGTVRLTACITDRRSSSVAPSTVSKADVLPVPVVGVARILRIEKLP